MSKVQQRIQSQLILHGAMILLLGMVLGFPYALAITGAWRDDAVRAWRVAHTGVSAVGVAIIAIGASVAHLALGERAALLLYRSMLVSGYAFTVGLSLVAVAGVRGLRPTGPTFNLVAFAIDVVAAVAAFLGVVLVIGGAYAAGQRQ